MREREKERERGRQRETARERERDREREGEKLQHKPIYKFYFNTTKVNISLLYSNIQFIYGLNFESSWVRL